MSGNSVLRTLPEASLPVTSWPDGGRIPWIGTEKFCIKSQGKVGVELSIQ